VAPRWRRSKRIREVSVATRGLKAKSEECIDAALKGHSATVIIGLRASLVRLWLLLDSSMNV
jgi:hypothetical protein